MKKALSILLALLFLLSASACVKNGGGTEAEPTVYYPEEYDGVGDPSHPKIDPKIFTDSDRLGDRYLVKVTLYGFPREKLDEAMIENGFDDLEKDITTLKYYHDCAGFQRRKVKELNRECIDNFIECFEIMEEIMEIGEMTPTLIVYAYNSEIWMWASQGNDMVKYIEAFHIETKQAEP